MSEVSEELVIPLSRAITLGDQSYDRLVLREPTGGELLAINAFEGTTADIVAVSRVSGVPQVVIRQVPARILNRAADYLAATLKVPADFLTGDDPPDVLDLPLRRPVEFDGRTLDGLRLQEPSAGQLEAFNKFKGTERDIVAVATVAGIPRQAAEKILGGDLLRSMTFINSFLQGDLTTGAN